MEQSPTAEEIVTSDVLNTSLPVIKQSEADIESIEPDLILPSESIEGSITTMEEIKELNHEYAFDVDLFWNRNVEFNSPIKHNDMDNIKRSKPDIRNIIGNPFLQRILNPKPSPELKIDFGPTEFMLYPILLDNNKVQSYIISDYELKKQLSIHEKLIQNL